MHANSTAFGFEGKSCLVERDGEGKRIAHYAALLRMTKGEGETSSGVAHTGTFPYKTGAQTNLSSASVPENPDRDGRKDHDLPAQVMTVTVTKDVKDLERIELVKLVSTI